ncbi:AraC family transcriptional regulator [Paenibacillus sp. N4]|uniref:helix-turn-helix domain-containing protein n=1 Tax=Paenibacillus vietnamensis TaxID=2590547 RepID=UPI001CD0E113|nr:AraC family transcriptional regulator [Paenibacillus vietnamensis]MCA0758101.1 AraC family transcriptional regulator [Paenibacillus vietnamensis]
MSMQSESCSYGSTAELFVEYMKRTEPYTMGEDHYHDYYEIYYLLSGQRVYFIRDRSYSVEQGDLVFIDKHELHKTIQAGDAAHERIILHFPDSFVRSLSADAADFLLSPFRHQSRVIRLPRQEQLAVEQAVRRLLGEIGKQPAGYELAVRHQAGEILLTTARFLQQHEPVPLHHSTPMHAKVSEIIRYINANFAEPLRLQAISEQFFVSPYYLSHMFKKTTGFTYSDYITLTRVKEAQRLLRETGLSISDIAAAAGFDNFSHFGKTFKKITHLSPRDYRKQQTGI